MAGLSRRKKQRDSRNAALIRKHAIKQKHFDKNTKGATQVLEGTRQPAAREQPSESIRESSAGTMRKRLRLIGKSRRFLEGRLGIQDASPHRNLCLPIKSARRKEGAKSSIACGCAERHVARYLTKG
ncbi:hypothetical protein MRX96_028880 [Rhipicephalus microplus]